MRVFIIHTLIFLTQLSLSAQNQRLSISSFNDNWGGGFTQIKDDYRSFGFSVVDDFFLKDQKARVRLDYSGFTNRLSTDSTRLDEIVLRGNIPFYTLDDVVTFQAIGGIIFTGNFGGEQVQNSIHNQVAIENIHLHYPESNQVYGMFGGRLQGDFPIIQYRSADLVFKTTAEYFWAPNYQESVFAKIGIGLQNSSLDAIKVEYGINHQFIYNEPTRALAAKNERGFFLGFTSNLGLAKFSILVFPESNFSMGALGINLLNGNRRKPLKTIDVTAEYGAFTKEQGLYQRYLWNKITRHQNHFQFELHQQFWRINGSANPNFPNQYGHFNQLSLGGNYSPIAPNTKFQLLPYISARIGYKTENLYAGEAPSTEQKVWSLNAIGEIGLRVKLPANILHKNCYYGGAAGYSYAAPFYRSDDVIIANGYKFAQPVGAFSFGGFVMIDL